MEPKRTRSHNFTESEKNVVFELVTSNKYKDIIENKETDAVTTARKHLAWQEIAQTFNSQSQTTGRRTAKQLRELYLNMKHLAKSNLLANKKNAYKTRSIAQFEPVSNRHDSIATYVDTQPCSSRDAESSNIECELEDVEPEAELRSEPSSDSETSSMRAAESPEGIPNASMGQKRKAVPSVSVAVPKNKNTMETLSTRFAQRKNLKDQHDAEVHAKRLEILNIEKETKLKQLAIVELQLEQQHKLFELNYKARLEEIAYERKLRETELHNFD